MSEIYSTNWEKYKNCNFEKAISLESSFKSEYHTCDALMTRKQQLERLVKRCDNQRLKKHFQTTELENQIIELTKDILFIYSKKREEREYLDDLINSIEAEIAHREEMREWEIEYWRGCD